MSYFDEVIGCYRDLSSRFPAELDREDSELCLNEGEPESALTGLLEEAYENGSLTEGILDEVEKKFDLPPIGDTVRALRAMMRSNNSAA